MSNKTFILVNHIGHKTGFINFIEDKFNLF